MTSEQITDLYRRHGSVVHARARRLVGDDADDVLHDVFIRLVRNPPKTDEILPWLLVTTTNACLDRLRHRTRRDESWRSEARAALGPGEATIDRLLEAQEVCRQLLGRFDAKTEQVAAMVLVDGMSQESVAQLLGVTRTAVAKRLQRFLRDARRLLGVSETGGQTSSG